MLSFYCTDCKETIACPDWEGPIRSLTGFLSIKRKGLWQHLLSRERTDLARKRANDLRAAYRRNLGKCNVPRPALVSPQRNQQKERNKMQDSKLSLASLMRIPRDFGLSPGWGYVDPRQDVLLWLRFLRVRRKSICLLLLPFNRSLESDRHPRCRCRHGRNS